jgi:Na+/H+ antiporter NhaC
MTPYGWLSILPPAIALGLAIKTKQVYVSLLLGIWVGWTIMSGWNPAAGMVASVDLLVDVFSDRDRTLTILLSAMIGAVILYTQYSGGVAGFMRWASERKVVTGRRSAGVLAWAIGFVIFVEANIGVFISGPVSRPVFDRLRISREKLAYILDSTASAKATLIPLNSWGAYIIGMLAAGSIDSPLRTLLVSIPLNFYAWAAVLLALVVATSDWHVGPLREAERRIREEGKLLRDGAEPLVAGDVLMVDAKDGVPPRAANLVVPIIAIVVTVLIGLYLTGGGELMNGEGATSAFWAIAAGIVVAAVMYLLQGIMTLHELTDSFMRGVGGLIPIVVLLVLAYGIGDTCRAIGTGEYLARAAQASLPSQVMPALLFVLAAVTSFSTGTSWGTWAIMMPIALPMVPLLGLHPALTVAAVLGGGLFGDHSSPISDSTIISSMAAGTDHIDHVRTQLPYALLGAAASIGLYLVLGTVL